MNEADIQTRAHVTRPVALLPTTLVAVLVVAVGISGHATGAAPATQVSGAPSVAEQPFVPAAGETPIVLELPHGTATAVLADTPTAHQLAATLPVRLTLRDPMGQAKSGRLPTLLDTAWAERTLDPEVGGIYYWPPSGDVAVFYDDLGQTVPPPGLVRLSTVTDGLPVIARAGRRFDVSLVGA